MKIKLPIVYLLMSTLILSSCAVSNHSKGMRHLKNNEFNEAITLLQQAEQEKPNDYRIKRDLGIAFYKARRFDSALEKFAQSKEIKLDDSKTVFYTGLTYEAQGRIDEAISEYKSYLDLRGSRKFKNEISKRIRQLTLEKISAEITQAIAQEQNIDPSNIPQNTVAVLSFKNLGNSSEYDPLQKGLAQMLITDLAKVNQIQVVERLKLQKLLDELELGASGLVEQGTAPRVGKLVGANRIITGAFTDLSDENFRIDASMTETATTEISEIDEVTGELDKIFKLQKDLAFSIIDDMGIQLSKEERDEIQKIPTESLLAFMAYSKGLDFEDRGLFDQARQQYQQAAQIDPNFTLAKNNLDDVQVNQSAATEPKTATAELEDDMESSEASVDGGSRMSRLVNTSAAAQTGQTPQGDNDTRETAQEVTGTDKPVTTTATIPVRVGPLPLNKKKN